MAEAFNSFEWEDHFTHASGLVKMIEIAAQGMDDLRAQAAFMSVAESIQLHIEMGVNKVAPKIRQG